jgi:asparagine synthase (glutamine-hydrolysing)
MPGRTGKDGKYPASVHRDVQRAMKAAAGVSRSSKLEMDRAVSEVRERVLAAVERAPAECLLLSGGLDTSILAAPAAARGTHAAVTVLASADAPDRAPSTAIANALGLTHHVVDTTLEGLLEDLEFVVRTLVTFDPMEVRNSLVISRALREVAAQGYRSAMTGDAADELFGGYSFMMRMPDSAFERYSREMAANMRFSSQPLGKALGLEVRAPYTDPEMIRYAVELPKSFKVRERDGREFGKWILREAFPEAASRWRRKDPIEVGSGSTALPAWFAERTPNERLRAAQAEVHRDDRIDIRDAEHLAYYRVFRKVHLGRLGERTFEPATCCAHCGFGLPRPTSTFCLTCGAYPARP